MCSSDLACASGVSALIYEVVWYPLLQLIIGTTTTSLGWLLAAFMGGMCLGSLLFPKFGGNPWRAYAALECGIGLLGLAVLFGSPQVSAIYTAWAGEAGPLLRGAVAALCLTPPAILMGATLPALYRCARSATSGGTIYAANLVGAVLGCLWAGFYLLPRYDMATATYAAAALNFALAGVSFLASKIGRAHV